VSDARDVHDVDALKWIANNGLRSILERRRVEETDGQLSPDMHSGVSVQVGYGLSALVRSRPISRVLEIGLANGFSSMFILDALDQKPDGLLVSFDPFQDTQWEGRGRANIGACGFRTPHEVLTLASWDAYALLKARDMRFDLVFIDGSHAFDNCFVDFFLSQKLLAPGGYIAFDDVGWAGVERVCEYVLANRDCEVELAEGR
jgi:predicted O-methyltransferase YrrM